jgi:hypothetical protein
LAGDLAVEARHQHIRQIIDRSYGLPSLDANDSTIADSRNRGAREDQADAQGGSAQGDGARCATCTPGCTVNSRRTTPRQKSPSRCRTEAGGRGSRPPAMDTRAGRSIRCVDQVVGSWDTQRVNRITARWCRRLRNERGEEVGHHSHQEAVQAAWQSVSKDVPGASNYEEATAHFRAVIASKLRK